MEILPVQALIPIGVILAALIGGYFSLISLIISKEQKTSEFRQQWIDSLRNEISDHIAASTTLSAMRQLHSGSDEEFLKGALHEQQRLVSTFTAIKLRVNPSESDKNIKELNDRFLKELERGRRLYNELQWEDARKGCNHLTDAAIPLLKAEWERVKRGEKSYVLARRTAMGVSGFSFVALIAVAVMLWPSAQGEEVGIPSIEQEKLGHDSQQHN